MAELPGIYRLLGVLSSHCWGGHLSLNLQHCGAYSRTFVQVTATNELTRTSIEVYFLGAAR